MDLISYSHIELDHDHADDFGNRVPQHDPRAEGWYLNPFDCREEMFWTGSAWTQRRSSNTSDPAPLGFEVAPGRRDVRIRAEMHHLQTTSVAPIRRPSTIEVVVGCASVGILLLATWRSAVVRIVDNGAGIDLPLTFRDLRSDKDFELAGFLLSYLGKGVVLSTIAALVLLVALLYGKFSSTGVRRPIIVLAVVLAVVFVALAVWLLLFVVTLRREADFGEGGLLLGIWLSLISHLMCSASAFALSRPQKAVRT